MDTAEERCHGTPRILVIGMGNAYRCDDAVGLWVTQCLQRENMDGVLTCEASGDGTALLEAWSGADVVILIDAVRSGVAPGTVYRFDIHETALPEEVFRYSTHAFGVADTIALARMLNRLPPRLIVYGIEGHTFSAGVGLSPAVEAAVAQVVTRVQREITRAKTSVRTCHA